MFNIFGPKVPQVTVEELKRALDAHEDFVLLDVRTPEEHAKEKIKGSSNLSVDQVAQKIEKVIPDKKKKIYVHCLSGGRSANAVATMLNLGYTNVYDVKSGMLAWRVKGYPTV